MVKLEWGTKRCCQSCSARFYDLQRSPIICPKCAAVYELATTTTTRRGKKAAIADEAKTLAFSEDEALLGVDLDIAVDIGDDDLIVVDDDLDDDLNDVADVLSDEKEDRHH